MSSSKSRLKLLSDENIPSKLVKLLEEEGFDIKLAPFSIDDEEVASIANLEGRIILTFDRHFGNILLFPPERYSGIIFIRIRPPLIKSVFTALLNLFKTVKPSEFKGRLFTLTLFGFRPYPKLSRQSR